MKKLLILCLFIKWSPCLFSQCDTIYYYDSNSSSCSKAKATRYIKIHCNDEKMIVYTGTEYYANGTKKSSEGTFVKETSGIFPYGEFVYYYADGKIESKGGFDYAYSKKIRGAKKGKWTDYYENGQKKCEFNYDGLVDGLYDEHALNCWDSTGKQTLTNGNGYRIYYEKRESGLIIVFNCQYKDGKQDGNQLGTWAVNGKMYCTEDYSAGKLLQGTSYDAAGNKYTYTKLIDNPVFPGADAGLMSYLQKNIEYPAFERDNDIQGNVLIRFVVMENGETADFQVIRSISEGLDKEAVRVVKKLPKFTPGYQRGQAVRVYFYLPVVFKLQ